MGNQPQLQVINGGGQSNGARVGASGAAEQVEGFLTHVPPGGAIGGNELERIVGEISQLQEFANTAPGHLRNLAATAAARKAAQGIHGILTVADVQATAAAVGERAGQLRDVNPNRIAQLQKQVERNAAADKARAAAKKPSWSHALSTEQKVNAGLWGAGALLSGIGMYYAVKNSRTVDENGKPDIRWTQVGVALLQAAMTAGCAFMAYEATRGAAIR